MKLDASKALETEKTNAVAILGFTMATQNAAMVNKIKIFPRVVGSKGITRS
jgi:hypothetical protein